MKGALAALALLALALPAQPVRAAVEEFSTFDVLGMEVDDENLLDHFLSRPPAEWADAWEGAHTALRADQGCMTSALWYQSNEFKARSPLGSRSWLDTGFFQRTDPEATWEWFQVDIRRRTTGWGVLGARIRPAYDKARQDFAATWDTGDSSAALQVHAVFTFEDAFNSFWEFRQERSGNRAEPYRKHPFEPALALEWRGASRRARASGVWLTPSRKDIVDPDPALSGSYSLWGEKSRLEAEQRFGRIAAAVAFENLQALSSQRIASAAGDGRTIRRRWTAELTLRRPLSRRLRAEAAYLYMSRDQAWRPPVASAAFRALDRLAVARLEWEARPDLWLRAGWLHDRVGIAREGAVPGFSYGSRTESRGIVGFRARFDRVLFELTEGVELDAEPYSVTLHHDKAFFHMQTAF